MELQCELCKHYYEKNVNLVEEDERIILKGICKLYNYEIFSITDTNKKYYTFFGCLVLNKKCKKFNSF